MSLYDSPAVGVNQPSLRAQGAARLDIDTPHRHVAAGRVGPDTPLCLALCAHRYAERVRGALQRLLKLQQGRRRQRDIGLHPAVDGDDAPVLNLHDDLAVFNGDAVVNLLVAFDRPQSVAAVRLVNQAVVGAEQAVIAQPIGELDGRIGRAVDGDIGCFDVQRARPRLPGGGRLFRWISRYVGGLFSR